VPVTKPGRTFFDHSGEVVIGMSEPVPPTGRLSIWNGQEVLAPDDGTVKMALISAMIRSRMPG
jgi:hypothetical protein